MFPFHGLCGNDPLLSILAGVNPIDQFSVGNRLSQGAFVQSPKLRSVAK